MLNLISARQARLFAVIVLILLNSLLLAACDNANVTASSSPNSTIPDTPGGVTNKTSRFAQLLNYLPDSGDLPKLVYNDFATSFQLYGISPDSYTSSPPDPYVKFSDGQSPSLLVSLLSTLAPSGASNFTARIDQVKAFGWSRFQVSDEIYTNIVFDVSGTTTPDDTSIPLNGTRGLKKQVYILYGRFDPKAIDETLSAKGYQKQSVGSDTLYSIGQEGQTDPRIQLYDFRMGLNNIGVLADGSAIITSAYKQPATNSLELLAAKTGNNSLAKNPAVKALAQLYEPAQMVTLFNIHLSKEIDDLGHYDFRLFDNQPDKKDKARKLSAALPKFPAAKMGGVAYYEPRRGERYLWLATYYDTPEKAKEALPAMERLIKEGYPYNTGGTDYNTYTTVVEAIQKDNILSFKLKVADKASVFYASAFAQTNYPLGLYKE